MARPRQVSDADIDRAARETFMEHGPQAPVALVARKLGVSHAALFQRTGTKEELMLRALAPGVPAVVAVLQAGPRPGAGVGRQLVELLKQVHRAHRDIAPGLLVLKAAGVDVQKAVGHGEPPPVVLRALLARWLHLGRLAPEKRARALAEGLLGAIEARCFNQYLGGAHFALGRDEDFVRELVQGLLPELSLTKE